jgi:MarR family transcriptional regulator for hemolysin
MTSPDDRSNIGHDLALSSRRWRARVDQRLAPFGLTQAKWVPLRHLWRAGGSLPQYRLAEHANIEGPSLVRVLDELERRGLIKRCDSDADRRSKIVHLTDKAAPLLDEIAVRLDQLREEVLDGVPDEDVVILNRVLARILFNLEKSDL